MYSAVVCPKCRKGFAVDLEHRTSSCPHCGRQVQTRRMKYYFSSDSASLTAKAVGELNRRGREIKDFKGAPAGNDRAMASIKDLDAAIEEMDEFTAADLASRLMTEDVDPIISRLLLKGSIYESSAGRFRKV